jgi:hypothetical protein
MNNLIIKFTIREAKIMWIINDNWIMLISFLLTMVTGIAYRRMKNSNKKIKIPNQKGGAFIDECIEPDSIYELVDRPLEIVLKQMLNLPPEAGPLVISGPLLILAYIVSSQPIKQVTILGVSFFVDKFKSLAIKTGIGIVSGSIFFFTPVGVVSLTSTLVAGAIIFNVAHGISSFECDNFVSKVTMDRVSQEKSIGFLETLPEKTPKVFIKGSEDTELYIPSHNDNDVCFSEYKQWEIKKSKKLSIGLLKTETPMQIHRKCETTYVPLKQRTKTLADLKKEDSTENRKKAEPYIKRYEDRRKRIIDKRLEL